jgi:predicted small lipoprotein YifL
MDKVKKVFALLIVAVVLVGLAGCKKKSETPDIDHPTEEAVTEQVPTEEDVPSEHPAADHPTKETVTEEAPTEEDVPNEPPSAEHPTGEHPK